MMKRNTVPVGELFEKQFPGQQRGENIETVTPLHWVTMMPYLFVLLGITGIVSVLNYLWFRFYGSQDSLWIVIFIDSTIALILLHLFFVRLMNYFLRVILVTNYRLLDLNSSTVLRREKKTVDFATIQDIEYSQKGLIQRFLNYGTISIHNAAGEKHFTFHFIPRPSKFYNRLNHIYRKAQFKRPATDNSQALH